MHWQPSSAVWLMTCWDSDVIHALRKMRVLKLHSLWHCWISTSWLVCGLANWPSDSWSSQLAKQHSYYLFVSGWGILGCSLHPLRKILKSSCMVAKPATLVSKDCKTIPFESSCWRIRIHDAVLNYCSVSCNLLQIMCNYIPPEFTWKGN